MGSFGFGFGLFRLTAGDAVVAAPPWVLSGAALDLDLEGDQVYGADSFADVLGCARTIDGGVSYAVNAAGVLVPFSDNVLRRTDRGLLIEEGRTNIHLHSSNLGTGYTMAGSTATTNTEAAPDGTTTADTNTGSTSAELLRNSSAITISTGVTYTYSRYVKKGNFDWVRMQVASETGLTNGVRGWFDLTNGVIGNLTAHGSNWSGSDAFMQALGGSWYRVGFRFQSAVATTLYAALCSASANAATTRANIGSGAGVGTVAHHWGAQVELGAGPLSLIPTAGSAATRSAEVIATNIELEELLAGAAWSVSAKVRTVPAVTKTILGRAGAVGLGLNSTPGARSSDGSTTINATGSADDDFSVALGVDATGRSLSYRGGTVTTDSTDITHATSWSRVGSHTGGDYLNDYLERLAVWNSRLSNATLEALRP